MENKTIDMANSFDKEWEKITKLVPEIFNTDDHMSFLSKDNLHTMCMGFFMAGVSAVIEMNIKELKSVNKKYEKS